jgi:uncharacterized membrane protein/sporulation protein YlmC with PRC-barrel domain
MINIPLDAAVRCADGDCGRSVCVIVSPETAQVTHFVVQQAQPPHTRRLVSVDRVVETTAASVTLDCTEDELSRMDQFVLTEYHQVEIPRYVGVDTALPYYSPMVETVPVEKELIPEGGLAVRPGSEVQATDGKVGRVDELLADSSTGQITHLVLRKEHLWGKKDVLIPVSMVNSVAHETVYLKLDKQTISSLLSVPAKRSSRIGEMELLVLALRQPDAAKRALQTLKNLAKQDAMTVVSAAVLVKDKQGKTSITETGDVHPRHGALFGAVTGGLVGLLAGPVGAVVGAAAGAATGRAAARRMDLGLPDGYLEQLQGALPPGTSALVAMVDRESVEAVADALVGFQGTLLHQPLPDEVMVQIAEKEGVGSKE